MPIRINLLAEQQYAEEMRRKDPVKKAIWVGAGVVSLMLIWILSLWFDLRSVKKEVEGYRSQFAAKTNEFLQKSNQFRNLKDLESRLKSLTRYSTNRFLWATALDALQHTTVTNVRMTKLLTVQTYVTNLAIAKNSNAVFNITPPRKWWQLFGKGPPQTNIFPDITNYMNSLTNMATFQTNRTEILKSYTLKTNVDLKSVTAAVTLTKPLSTIESRTLVLSGKDYTQQPPGQQILALTNAVLSHPFFKTYLAATNVYYESSFQLQADPVDKDSGEFVEFTIYCNFPQVVRINEP